MWFVRVLPCMAFAAVDAFSVTAHLVEHIGHPQTYAFSSTLVTRNHARLTISTGRSARETGETAEAHTTTTVSASGLRRAPGAR